MIFRWMKDEYYDIVRLVFNPSRTQLKIIISWMASLSKTLLSWNKHMVMSNSFSCQSVLNWKCTWHTHIRAVVVTSCFTKFQVKCFSSGRTRALQSSKVPKPRMAEESDAFYVVRKGDLVGIYKRLSDCQAQVSSSVCDPSVSVYKGYSLPKEAEDHLVSQGFKDALYSMHATYLKADMFGTLIPCPFQQPNGLAFSIDKAPEKSSQQKRLKEGISGSDVVPAAPPKKVSKMTCISEVQPLKSELGISGSGDVPAAPPKKVLKMTSTSEIEPLKSKLATCILEFDGASKGNPGQAGAGAVLRTQDGNVVSRIREGLGVATNNMAEYRALILGMKYALKRGFKHIQVQGDSKLVCMQVQDIWQTKNQNILDLCKEAKKLKDMFQSFSINHVRREFNSFADDLANLAINLSAGEVCEDYGPLSEARD